MLAEELPLLLRVVIGDLSDTPTYSDDRLSQLLLVAAQFVQKELTFSQPYVIDYNQISITPDPTILNTSTNVPRDDSFINLVVLKSACLLVRSGFVRGSGSGIRIRDNDGSEIDMTSSITGTLALIKNFCEAYEDAKFQYQYAKGIAGAGILSRYHDFVNHYRNMYLGEARYNRDWWY